MTKKKAKAPKRLKPISLDPLTPEEALRAFLHTPPLQQNDEKEEPSQKKKIKH